MKEEWKDIPDYHGYKISNFGRVVNSSGHELKPWTHKNGYRFITLYKRGKGKGYHIARLVLCAFHPIDANGMAAAHINGNRTDNRLTNLTWATPTENTRQMLLHNKSVIGRKAPSAKLNEEQVISIYKQYWLEGRRRKDIASQFKVCPEAVSLIVHHKTWRHLNLQKMIIQRDLE